MADSDQLRVGDFAVAVGNPFGTGQTATSGIISALGRSGLNLEGLENFIQTDASINRGNSGGALVNLNGELIGINTAILAPSGGNVGIGFAIPSNMAQNLSQQLIEFGEVKRGLLGIKGSEMTPDMAKAFNTDAQRGAFVSEVLPKSAAAKAGIKAGDITVSVDGKPVSSFAELRAKVGTTAPGKTSRWACCATANRRKFRSRWTTARAPRPMPKRCRRRCRGFPQQRCAAERRQGREGRERG